MSSFLSLCRSRFKWLCVLIISTLLAACGSDAPPLFKGSDITGTGLGSELAMVDHNGIRRTLADYQGKALVVFFGFTHCPDVCPTALAHLAQTKELLGDKADDVQVVMVSVDPERDTPEVLARYMTAFDDSFGGLTGSEDDLKKTAKSFKAYYAKVPDRATGSYTMDHSASFYLFDKAGQARVLANGTASAQDLASDIELMLN